VTRAAEGAAAGADALTKVDALAMNSGIVLARWFANEAERVYAALAESPEEREARWLLETIRARGGRISPRDLSQSGPRRLRGNTSAAEGVLEGLVRAGYGVWDEGTPGPAGGRPSRVFLLSTTSEPLDDETPGFCEDGEVLSSVSSGNESQTKPDWQGGLANSSVAEAHTQATGIGSVTSPHGAAE